jgi:hypothetical protein
MSALDSCRLRAGEDKGPQHRVASRCQRAACRAPHAPGPPPARPPQLVRVPRILPLSRFNDATPTKTTIWRRTRVPSSGNERTE